MDRSLSKKNQPIKTTGLAQLAKLSFHPDFFLRWLSNCCWQGCMGSFPHPKSNTSKNRLPIYGDKQSSSWRTR